jgi:hypothetical protein
MDNLTSTNKSPNHYSQSHTFEIERRDKLGRIRLYTILASIPITIISLILSLAVVLTMLRPIAPLQREQSFEIITMILILGLTVAITIFTIRIFKSYLINKIIPKLPNDPNPTHNQGQQSSTSSPNPMESQKSQLTKYLIGIVATVFIIWMMLTWQSRETDRLYDKSMKDAERIMEKSQKDAERMLRDYQ